MSENTVNVALDCIGFGKGIHTGDDFRSSARIILDGVLRNPAEIIEHKCAVRLATHTTAQTRTKIGAR